MKFQLGWLRAHVELPESAEEVAESIRISLGRFTTEAELDVVLERLTAAIARLESA